MPRPRKQKKGRSISFYLNGETLEALGPDPKRRVLDFMSEVTKKALMDGVVEISKVYPSEGRVKLEIKEPSKPVPTGMIICKCCGKLTVTFRPRCLHCTAVLG